MLISVLVKSRGASPLYRPGAKKMDSILRDVVGGVLCPLASQRLRRPKSELAWAAILVTKAGELEVWWPDLTIPRCVA